MLLLVYSFTNAKMRVHIHAYVTDIYKHLATCRDGEEKELLRNNKLFENPEQKPSIQQMLQNV